MRKIGFDTRIHDTSITNKNLSIGNHGIIDIGVYISTTATIGSFVHIAPYVCIIGGLGSEIVMEDFTAISAGSKIICGSDDFSSSLLGPQIGKRFRNIKQTVVTMRKFSAVGVNSVVMPGIEMAEGSVLGANSILTKNTEPWGIYVGSPAKLVGYRKKTDIMKNSDILLKIMEYKIHNKNKFSRQELPPYAHLIVDSVGSVGNIAFAANHLYFNKGYCKEIYIDIAENKKTLTNYNGNRYDDILSQKLSDVYVPIECYGCGLFNYDDDILEDIRTTVKPFFNFQKRITDVVDSFCRENNINEKTLGVHIRMNDMNAWHGQEWGTVYYDDYLNAIIENAPNYENIFISSDNEETLKKLKKDIDIIYYNGVHRAKHENVKGSNNELRDMAAKKLETKFAFETPFIDMLTLARCGGIIGRKYSNFTTAAIVLGVAKYENVKLL